MKNKITFGLGIYLISSVSLAQNGETNLIDNLTYKVYMEIEYSVFLTNDTTNPLYAKLEDQNSSLDLFNMKRDIFNQFELNILNKNQHYTNNNLIREYSLTIRLRN